MAYCRMGSLENESDVYVYEDCDRGWATHVATFRYVTSEEIPPPVPLTKEDAGRWLKRHRLMSDIRERASRVKIGGLYDGASFYHPTPGECANWLEHLKDLGYIIPDYAIEELKNEAREMSGL